MNEDQHTSQRWMVNIKGCEQVSVLPSERLEIGRKPIRPLADDGNRRFDVPDDTRSMSKRHALFAVAANGSATVRDLSSTNGTYVVRDDGTLIRLPEQVDFPLPSAAVRMQFGDVPVDFVQVEQPQTPPAEPVSDLFDYALSDAKPEPDATDMSVDDILDLRAGEPTSIFDAGSVTRRAGERLAAQSRTFTPGTLPSVVLHQGIDDVDGVEDDAVADSMPLNVMPVKPQMPRDLFADAMVDRAAKVAQSDQPVAQPEQSDQQSPDNATVSGNVDVTVAVPVDHTSRADETATPTAAETTGSTPMFTPLDNEPYGNAVDFADLSGSAERADDSRFAGPREGASPAVQESQTVYPSAFEPGSVFERVSKGGFAKPEPLVEAGGFTSDEAKRTDDFSKQYAMARHRQLLPFLAMNPALYDDLYAWLSAQGDGDIDAALSDNPGYQEYRKAVGK